MPRCWKPNSANAPSAAATSRWRPSACPPYACQAPLGLNPSAADPTEDPRLARLPTEEEIAEAVRRRPIGAVIVDICCDLGIAPGDIDRPFWDEINHAVIMYGGNLVPFFSDLSERLWAFGPGELSDEAYPGWLEPPPRSPVPATGPP